MMAFDYYIPTRLHFGAGKLELLGELPLPGRKALIVTTAGKSVRSNGYLDRVVNLLRRNRVESVIFDRVQPNPLRQQVMEGAALARQEKCDLVLGLGGGSAIDSAKAIAVMATNPGDYWHYVTGGSGLGQALVKAPLPVIAVTTTAGTGTEADPWTVVTHETLLEKIGFGSTETFPWLSIVDPELMLTVPPQLTAFQGFDALFHAMEGYIATVANPLSDLFALKSVELVSGALADAVHDGKNLEARTRVALANTLSGMVEATSCCTSEHSIAHALSAFHDKLPHGAALIAISIAYWRRFEAAVPERCAELARAMGAEDVVSGLRRLQQACGVAEIALSEYGVRKEELAAIADNAAATMGNLFKLDRKTLDRDEVIAILEESYR